MERKHRSEREYPVERAMAKADVALIETEAKETKKQKVKRLKPARSQAELTRVRQGYLLISLNCLNVCIAALIALKTFGII